MSNKRRIKTPKLPPQNVPVVGREPGIAFVVTIKARENGTIDVNGFPPNLKVAMAILAQAQQAIADYFVRAAHEGRLGDDGIAEPRRIVVPN